MPKNSSKRRRFAKTLKSKRRRKARESELRPVGIEPLEKRQLLSGALIADFTSYREVEYNQADNVAPFYVTFNAIEGRTPGVVPTVGTRGFTDTGEANSLDQAAATANYEWSISRSGDIDPPTILNGFVIGHVFEEEGDYLSLIHI